MSKANRRVRKRKSEIAAMQILEEAFHLVRTADPVTFWKYYLGAVPWAVGLLYFVADMGRSSLADRDAAFAALALAGLYFWMRMSQARFCASLWARLDPGGIPAMTGGERFRAHAAHALCQSAQVPLLAIGLFFAIPLGWILATQQNFAALALTTPPSRRPFRDLLVTAVRFSHEQWAQNHGILIIFFFVSLFTLINFVGACLLLPSLMKAVFAIETVFTISPQAAILNTTFVFGAILLMQLAIGPLMNAAYVLRCFYARSRTTGADLLGRLEQVRERRREEVRREGNARIALVLVLVGFGLGAAPAKAENEANRADPIIEAERFQNEIAETLEQKKYQWQLSRRSLEGEEEAGESWLEQRLNEIAASAKRFLDQIGTWLEESIKRLFERGVKPSVGNENDTKRFQGLSSTVSVALLVIILGFLVWLAISMYLRHRGKEKEVTDETGTAAVIDLASEDIVATQLREDEWLRLAREQIEKGEERLAVRALFLATLAHLGEKGLLKIARFKSNRDYRAELALRARSLADLRRAFDENTGLFERSWYGMHRLAEGALEFYLKNHGLISDESAKAGKPSAGAVTAR